MRSSISYAALAVALAAGTAAANAQTFIPGQPVETVITQPPATVTTETVQTVRPARRAAPRAARRQVVTTRRTVTTTTPAPVAAIAANPAPFYDRAPLYDTVAPATLDETVLDAQPVATAVPVVTTVPQYRYVYEPDRILVVDPSTGIAVQALPR